MHLAFLYSFLNERLTLAYKSFFFFLKILKGFPWWRSQDDLS